MVSDFSGFVPALPMIRIDGSGAAFVAGTRCGGCGETVPGDRIACAGCGRRDALEQMRLGTAGRLYNYTIVHRSFPGLPVPYVAAIVDLDDGGTLRGTLTGVEPDPAKLPFDMPIEVVFRDTGQKDPAGKPFLSYFFVPATGAA